MGPEVCGYGVCDHKVGEGVDEQDEPGSAEDVERINSNVILQEFRQIHAEAIRNGIVAVSKGL